MDPVIIHQSLARLGFSMNAAHSVTTDQGLNSLEEICLLTDGEVVNVCNKALRKPGGMAANPDAELPNQSALVPNKGFMVSMRAEKNLLACYYLRHCKRMSRTTAAAQITTLDIVRGIHDLKLQ
jgi:hypothetical protein